MRPLSVSDRRSSLHPGLQVTDQSSVFHRNVAVPLFSSGTCSSSSNGKSLTSAQRMGNGNFLRTTSSVYSFFLSHSPYKTISHYGDTRVSTVKKKAKLNLAVVEPVLQQSHISPLSILCVPGLEGLTKAILKTPSGWKGHANLEAKAVYENTLSVLVS